MGGWVDEVLATRPRTAVFDCDGTLWGGDAGSGFMHWTLETGLLRGRAAAWLGERYRLYEAGAVDEATICGEMVQVYAGLPESELRASAERFFAERMEGLVFPEMARLVSELRAGGAEIWAVSSTCDWVIEAGVRERFGIGPGRVLAAKVRVRDGLVTDELLAVPTDEAKAEALAAVGLGLAREIATEADAGLAEGSGAGPEAVFGNSIHDLAMLRMALRAYPVNPTEALGREAARRGWPVFWPEGTGMAAQSEPESVGGPTP